MKLLGIIAVLALIVIAIGTSSIAWRAYHPHHTTTTVSSPTGWGP